MYPVRAPGRPLADCQRVLALGAHGGDFLAEVNLFLMLRIKDLYFCTWQLGTRHFRQLP